jgi:hypothetical protein
VVSKPTLKERFAAQNFGSETIGSEMVDEPIDEIKNWPMTSKR